MTRKKVKLAYISNDSARKATFKKRKKGLVKKVSELSTLCDVLACAIIYSPYDSQPEVWPPSPGAAHGVLSEFKKMPEMEQSKKMVNQESFLKHRLAKSKDQLKKLHKDNREREISSLMYRTLTLSASTSSSPNTTNASYLLHGLSLVDLNDLGWLIDQNLKDIHNRIDSLLLINKQDTTKKSTKAPPQQLQPAALSSANIDIGGTGPVLIKNNDLAAENLRVWPQPPHPHQHVVVEKEEETKGAIETTMASASTSTTSSSGVEAAIQNNKHQWLMDLLHSNDQIGFGGAEEMMLPFPDAPHSLNGLWSTAFFP